MKKICFITTSRADFGMVSELIDTSLGKKNINTSIIVSGNHYRDVQSKFKKKLSILNKLNIKDKNVNDLKIAISLSNYVKKVFY